MTKAGPTFAPSVSVAVLSHRRPHLLGRVLAGVDQLDYPEFEVVVVGDRPRLEDFRLPERIASQVRYVSYAEPNIGRARNLAIAASAGEIIAFLDDDAVPEPDWLGRMIQVFRFPDIGGSGGLVRAADGISVEWEGGVFNREGQERPMSFPDDMRAFDSASQVYGNEFIGTLGANSAFRRDAVLSVGGFDEAIRYYLDETDIMLRLAEAGWNAGLARTAEVHHLREENLARTRFKVPRNLVEIAASKAYFCKRHLPEEEIFPALERFRRARRRELDPYIRLGILRGRDRTRLLDQVEEGIEQGLSRDRRLADAADRLPVPFRRYVPGVERGALRIAISSGWGLGSIRRTRRLAGALAGAGHAVTCLRFYSGMRRPHVSFRDGVWLHEGGTWRPGRSAERRVVLGRRAQVEAELARITAHRQFDLVLSPDGRASPRAGDGALALRLEAWGLPLWARAPEGAALPLQQAIARLETELVGGGAADKSADAGPAAKSSRRASK